MSHCNSLVVDAKVQYWALEEDLEIVSCFLVFHDTREFPKKSNTLQQIFLNQSMLPSQHW